VEGDPVQEGRLVDLSAGGCRAFLKADYTIATPVFLHFSLPGGHVFEEQLAVVRSRHHLRDGLDYGFQFNAMADIDMTGLALFVARHQADLRGEAPPHQQVVVCTASKEDLRFAREMLHPRGFEVVHAGSLLDLGRLLDQARTALLLLHSRQGPVSARQICEAVRGDRLTREIPIAVYGEPAEADAEPEPGSYRDRLKALEERERLLACLGR